MRKATRSIILVTLISVVPGSASAVEPEPVVFDVNPGSGGSDPIPIFEFGDRVLFASDDGVHGEELWVSDGSAAGTFMVADIAAGPGWSAPRLFTQLGSRVFFTAIDDGQIWVTDGTADGTSLVWDPWSTPGVDYHSAGPLVALGDHLLFWGTDADHGRELWRSDGTPTGTRLVADVHPGPEGAEVFSSFHEHGGSVYFTADDGIAGRELWVSDGTESGTRLVRDINPGPSGSAPSSFVSAFGRLFFSADDGEHGYAVWTSDGTAAGTSLFLDAFAEPEDWIFHGPSSIPLVAIGDVLFLRVLDETHGQELWISDGTAAGTELLVDINPGPAYGGPLRWWEFGDRLLFSANDGAHGHELWITDGTAAGTEFLRDILPGPDSSGIEYVAVANGRAFFKASDSVGNRPTADYGSELWVTNGTPRCTTLLADVEPGPAGSLAESMTIAGDTLFFSASRGDVGRELWALPLGHLGFCDIGGNVHEANIEGVADRGITTGCDVHGTAFCPEDSVTRGQMASLLARGFELPPASIDAFSDDAGSVHEDNINRVAAAGITLGFPDGAFRPADVVTRAQMASFLRRAMGLSELPGSTFSDVGGVHEGSINAIAGAGVTVGCAPERFCPDDPVTRAQMASFLARALDL